MRKLAAWIKDLAFMFSGQTIMYFRRRPPKHYLRHVIDGKVPVIILPGLGARWGAYKKIADHISLLGHPLYIVPKLGNNRESIPLSAKKVREVIEENNLKNIILVAHSKGGIIGKYLLLHEDPENRIKGVIAIAAPFNGSSAAKLVSYKSAKELTPDSKIILYLKEHTEVNNKIVSIFHSYDNIVWHPNGSYLEAAKANVNTEIMGHSLILRNKKVWNTIVEWIEKITHE